MQLHISKSKNAISYYISESYRKNGKVTSRNIEKIGTHQELLDKGITNPEQYARELVKQRNEKLKNSVLSMTQSINFNTALEPISIISQRLSKNIGWLYIHKIFEKLGLNAFLSSISGKANYDLKAITEYFVVNRFLFPGSKREAFLNKENIFCSPKYSLHDGYRALTFLDKYNNELQKVLFNNTKEIIDMNTDVLYYDCTNFYFECEDQDDNLYNEDGDIIQWGLRKYGASKEHRPNPIIQMGLFTDKNGIPMSYCVHHGSNNEQNTVIPLEARMIKDYKTSKFIYCSDGGLGSFDNRFFNTFQGRDYVVTQSLRKTAEEELEFIFKDINWRYVDDDTKVSLETFKKILDKKANNEKITLEEEKMISRDMIYKMYPIKRKIPLSFLKKLHLQGNIEMDETIYITFSAKYYLYQKQLFQRQLETAKEWLKKDINSIRKGPNDIRRFIKTVNSTNNGEIALNTSNYIDEEFVNKESRFHGFYAVATSLDKPIKDILSINASRWKIEQSFRLLKSDFDTRPIYASTPEHIRAHISICYIALLIYRIIERQLFLLDENNNSFSSNQILSTIRNMNVIYQFDSYYQSIYSGSFILDQLENLFHCNLNKKYYKSSDLKSKFL